jgi:two-component system phosphate regulon response regulator PhoB
MNGSILVVEDEPITQRLIAANLERAGHRVMRAASVPEAIASIREVVPDLVLLDWILPNATGVSFARQLRTDQRTRDIPIIMLTGRSQDTDKVTGLEAGADDYITKPFSTSELLARIKAVIRRRAPLLSDEAVEVAGLRLDPAAHRSGKQQGRAGRHGIPPAALLHDSHGPGVQSLPASRRSLGRPRLRRGTHCGRSHS